jgi:hypothetical protein
MKVMVFHVMPYADLDLSVRWDFRSVWAVLPNSHFDPVNAHHLYNRNLDEQELCPELGFQELLALLQFGTLPGDLTEASMRRVATEVLPAIRTLTDNEYRSFEVARA